MMSRLRVDLERKGIVNSRQYGLTVGRGNDDAVKCLIDEVRELPVEVRNGSVPGHIQRV